ncbi:hypothetical protein [Flagellimonas eckloniae]|uniref:Uncharacterized protein n=1 Tax=Flagellimonas eckloniae TaxID=346185 RepID=A0A0Q0XIW5_9FLAO|nr:hypothetical protein [Allomuricauda eckloniae]KQC30881.1 hypothetical protein AAY42_14025 [Allomuricauda eckloniae]
MKTHITLILTLAMISCASENQQKGLDLIAKHYHTETSFSKGFKTNAGKTTSRFNIKVSNSPMLDTLRQDITASNIALMLYESFTEDEKDDYDFINVELQKDSLEESHKALYDIQQLSRALDQAAIFTNFSENLLQKNYNGIVQNIADRYQNPKLAGNLEAFMNGLYKAHGNLIEYKRIGFGIYTKPNNEKLFHYSGHLKFADGYIRPFILTTSMNVSNDYIEGYKLD